jgi:hypothetical protein
LEVAADGAALAALVAVVSGGRDKSRGNAAIALGTLCDDALADRAGGGLPALRAVAALRARVGALPGCLRALADAAVQCEPDVQAQAAIALAAVLARDGANADALAALDEGDALYRLVEVAAAPAHKAAQPANEALANVADVRDGSPAAAERLVLMPGVLPLLVDVMMREDNDGGVRPPSAPSPANRPLGVSAPSGGAKDMVAATVIVTVAVAVAATLVPNQPPGPAAPHRAPPSRGQWTTTSIMRTMTGGTRLPRRHARSPTPPTASASRASSGGSRTGAARSAPSARAASRGSAPQCSGPRARSPPSCRLRPLSENATFHQKST